MQKNRLKTIILHLTLLSLFSSISAQAANCPSLDEIKTDCIKGKKYNVCTFSAHSQGTIWLDADKYKGVDLPGKITKFVEVEFKSTSLNKKQRIGNLKSCIYATKDGLEVFLDPKQTKVAIQLDRIWRKSGYGTYCCNDIQSCQFNFISSK